MPEAFKGSVIAELEDNKTSVLTEMVVDCKEPDVVCTRKKPNWATQPAVQERGTIT